MMTFEPEDLPVMLMSLPWADCVGDGKVHSLCDCGLFYRLFSVFEVGGGKHRGTGFENIY
ncbi:hypothetical protein DSBG_2197 [Desulfosporosinus sp. BG]|nr:hypothetical protein DSBG_2197 [Desulfosporosinus sp. BG]